MHLVGNIEVESESLFACTTLANNQSQTSSPTLMNDRREEIRTLEDPSQIPGSVNTKLQPTLSKDEMIDCHRFPFRSNAPLPLSHSFLISFII